ncbi:hypothetical protein A3Q56_02039 [Intoshia linei]|uniref:Innexin n=1 Tax=Intoshia linei TaxID=1819745 RepID=A0A177B7N6_9BILA|nr:hypothetical protein A3Q56_02039 [Intoshia linei]
MHKINFLLGSTDDLNTRSDDDGIDRLHRSVTVTMLVVFAFIVTTGQYVGQPISCWVPAHFTGNHEDYANAYCWVKNTYYLPFDKNIPKIHQQHIRHMIPYYQWVPIILLLQAGLFFFPCLFWRSLNNRSGINIDILITSTIPVPNKLDEFNYVKYICNQLDRYIRNLAIDKNKKKTISLKHILNPFSYFIGMSKGNYLLSLYITTKVLYLLNAIMQIVILDKFLGYSFISYGVDVLWSMYVGSEWTGSKRFPRVTMCDFLIRRVGNIQRYTVQCALPINLFNEKIYLVIWFWFLFLVLLTSVNLISWLCSSFIRSDYKFIEKIFLRKMAFSQQEYINENSLKIFVQDYLKPDIIFLLRLFSKNTSYFTMVRVVKELYQMSLKKPKPVSSGSQSKSTNSETLDLI